MSALILIILGICLFLMGFCVGSIYGIETTSKHSVELYREFKDER